MSTDSGVHTQMKKIEHMSTSVRYDDRGYGVTAFTVFHPVTEIVTVDDEAYGALVEGHCPMCGCQMRPIDVQGAMWGQCTGTPSYLARTLSHVE